MRLLIAGWQGQIAQALMEAMSARDDVRACAVGRPALDICELRSIERAMADVRPDVIINTAAYTNVDKAESEPERARALNCEGARLLAEAAATRNAAIIHLSTDYVFDGAKSSPYNEADPATPETVYGQSKLAGEEAVRAANPRHIILRTAWVYSPFGRNFVKSILAKARAGEALEVVSDQRGSPTYAPHLADLILTLAARAAKVPGDQDPLWGVYHAAGAGGASWYEMARAVMASSSERQPSLRPISTAGYPTPAKRPAFTELDCSKLKERTGLSLPSWQSGLSDCLVRLSASHAVAG